MIFDGIKVVELAQYVFVPAAGAVLADLGAEVVKVEPPGGDPYRRLHGVNLRFLHANRSKRSVAIDVRDPDGREALLRLVEGADVFITSLRPGALRRAGLTAEELRARNPRLIYARGHGFGVRGPDAERPGYDASAFWARGGLAATMGDAADGGPVRQRPAQGDNPAGMHLAFGIAAALFRRERTGEGSVVDVSLLATAMWNVAMDVLMTQHVDPTATTPSGWNPLTEAYPTSDGRWLQLVLLEPDRYWGELCAVIGRPELRDDPRFADGRTRLTNAEACMAELRATFGSRTLAEWRDALATFSGPWEPMLTLDELVADPQIEANGYFPVVEGAGVRVVGPPAQFDETAVTPTAAPALGEHTDAVLVGAGYTHDEIAALRARGVLA